MNKYMWQPPDPPTPIPLLSAPATFLLLQPCLCLTSLETEESGLCWAWHLGLGFGRGAIRPVFWGAGKKVEEPAELGGSILVILFPDWKGKGVGEQVQWTVEGVRKDWKRLGTLPSWARSGCCFFILASSRIWRRQTADWPHLGGLYVRRGKVRCPEEDGIWWAVDRWSCGPCIAMPSQMQDGRGWHCLY